MDDTPTRWRSSAAARSACASVTATSCAWRSARVARKEKRDDSTCSTTSRTVALCERLASIARSRAASIDPARPPKSKTRYERATGGVSVVRGTVVDPPPPPPVDPPPVPVESPPLPALPPPRPRPTPPRPPPPPGPAARAARGGGYGAGEVHVAVDGGVELPPRGAV